VGGEASVISIWDLASVSSLSCTVCTCELSDLSSKAFSVLIQSSFRIILSRQFLNPLLDDASITDCGRRYQSLFTHWLKKLFLTLRRHLLVAILRFLPRRWCGLCDRLKNCCLSFLFLLDLFSKIFLPFPKVLSLCSYDRCSKPLTTPVCLLHV